MTTLRVDGMKCQHCVATAKRVLEDLGATEVIVDLARGEMSYHGALDEETVQRALAAKGFTVAN